MSRTVFRAGLAAGGLALGVVLLPRVARAGTHDAGNVAIIEDTKDVIVPYCDPGIGGGVCTDETYCQQAARYFYQTHCDDYDALVVFLDYTWKSTLGGFFDDPTGVPVQTQISGINRGPPFDHTARYGSAGRLEQCVSMTSLATKPDNPDAQVGGLFGLPLGISGIELVGHELGHHWLMGAEFDLGKGAGVEELLRQCDQSSHPCVPNLHYSGYTNSHSVMYGNFITGTGNGPFTVCGGTRGYNELDQYLMGLRTPSQLTSPNDVIWALDDGYHYGAADSAYAPGKCTTIAAGKYTRVDIGIQDFIRAMGPWSGPAAEVPIGWNVAFVLVEPAGHTASKAAIAKVDAYRSEFETWFTTATDGLGSVNTKLVQGTCTLPPPPTDGGTPDAGPPPVVDAGTPDAGPPPVVDAGTPDAGPPPGVDAGTPDAGPPPVVDAGAADAGGNGCGVIPCDDGGAPDAGAADAGRPLGTLATSGCGCSTAAASGSVIPAVALLFLLAPRRRRRA